MVPAFYFKSFYNWIFLELGSRRFTDHTAESQMGFLLPGKHISIDTAGLNIDIDIE
jgi:hypothetical protein